MGASFGAGTTRCTKALIARSPGQVDVLDEPCSVTLLRRRPLLVALFPRHPSELLSNTVNVPAVLAPAPGTTRCRQVGNDLARGDVALD